MPGTRRYASGGAYVKEHGGKTVTLYPKARSTQTPTLQYPANDGLRRYDKIRYY